MRLCGSFCVFPPIFGPIKNYAPGNTVGMVASGFQKLAKLTIFEEFFYTQNVNIARFARNVFPQLLCLMSNTFCM